ALAPGEPELRERIAGHGVEQQRQQRHAGRDQEAVEQVAPHARLGEQFAVVVERGHGRQQRRREVRRLAGLHERDRQHPQQRRQAEHGERYQQAVDDSGGESPVHSTPLRRANHSMPLVTATISTNSRNAIADALPRFHHLKPSSYIRYSTLLVLSSGPPWVITSRSANSW